MLGGVPPIRSRDADGQRVAVGVVVLKCMPLFFLFDRVLSA